MRLSLVFLVAWIAADACSPAGASGGSERVPNGSASIPGYPEGVTETRYESDGDGSMQPALTWFPDSEQAVPLLVALHTWSSDYRQRGGESQYARWCQQAGWAFIHPNFRGINKTRQAMGSDLAVADIRSAVAFAKTQTDIDPKRVYCVGVSGGGHASMLMAAREPELWAGVSAWCGISDLARWHDECNNSPFERYSRMIESALGGSPGESDLIRQNALHRSPLRWIRSASTLPPLDINHGLNDGRDGSVPFTHAIRAWNAAVPSSEQIPEPTLQAFYQTRTVPGSLAGSNVVASDPLLGDHAPIYRRIHEGVRLTIFEGGHEIVHESALNWLAAQAHGRPVRWNPKRSVSFSVESDDHQSGK